MTITGLPRKIANLVSQIDKLENEISHMDFYMNKIRDGWKYSSGVLTFADKPVVLYKDILDVVLELKKESLQNLYKELEELTNEKLEIVVD